MINNLIVILLELDAEICLNYYKLITNNLPLKCAILKWNPSSQKYTTTLDRAFQNMIYLHIAVIIDFSRCHNLIFIVIFPTKTNCISISLFYFDKLKYLLKSEDELEFQEV